MTEYQRRWRVVGVSLLLCYVVLGVLVFRAIGENTRIAARVKANSAAIETEVRSDCLFKRDVIRLPDSSPGKPSPVLVTLAEDARLAYLGKNCQGTLDPATGRPLGPPPLVRK